MKLSKKALANKVNSVRPYKSRTKRPCDFCRRRKTCCIIEKTTPCLACVQFNKGNCTFVLGPLKRVKRNEAKETPPMDELPVEEVDDEPEPALQPAFQRSVSTFQSSFESTLSGIQSSTPNPSVVQNASSNSNSLGFNMSYDYDLPVLGTFNTDHSHNQLTQNISNISSLGQLSPHTPAYSFQAKWGTSDAQGVVVNGPPALRLLMLSNSSLLSNMSPVSALSMSTGAYQEAYDEYGALNYYGLAWTEASDYDSLMGQMPEELKRYQPTQAQAQAQQMLSLSFSILAPMQTFDHYDEAYVDPLVQME